MGPAAFILRKTPSRINVNMASAGGITCSKGLFVLMPFPPTKIQLSLKPRALITELPRLEMRLLASSLSLQEHKHKKADIISRPHVKRNTFTSSQTHFVDASSKEAIITIVPSSISFKNVIKGATST